MHSAYSGVRVFVCDCLHIPCLVSMVGIEVRICIDVPLTGIGLSIVAFRCISHSSHEHDDGHGMDQAGTQYHSAFMMTLYS